MRYERVHVRSFGYELAPVVVTSFELEDRLEPLYKALHLQEGQLEVLTGIEERRWWEPGTRLSDPASVAAKRAVEAAGIDPSSIGAVVYGGVCREQFEPATACRIADAVGVSPSAAVHDVSNACLGAINGILDVANRIELGQIEHGLVVSCESSREINDVMIERMLQNPTHEFFRYALTTLTGGSGAVAMVISREPASGGPSRRLLGGVHEAAPEHNELCLWGLEGEFPDPVTPYMRTDSVGVLEHGVALGVRTWNSLMEEMQWSPGQVDRIICHQVGSGHTEQILTQLSIPADRDFTTFRHLGNIGTVSLPITAALAEEQGHLEAGQRVAFLGIGSGLNCLMLGLEW